MSEAGMAGLPHREGLDQFPCALEMREKPVVSLSLSSHREGARRSAYISMGRKRQVDRLRDSWDIFSGEIRPSYRLKTNIC